MIEIKLPDYVNDKINANVKKYADAKKGKDQSIDYYEKKRGVKDPKKAYWDIYNGKKGEYFTAIILNKKFSFPYLEPDCKILPRGEKNWNPDLPYQQLNEIYPNVAVKACSNSTYRFCKDYSWTFQYCNSDGIAGKDEIFEETSDNHYVALVYIPVPEESLGTLMVFAPWVKVAPFLRDPISPKYKGIKRCLYFEDLKNNIEELLPSNLNQWSLLNVT